MQESPTISHGSRRRCRHRRNRRVTQNILMLVIWQGQFGSIWTVCTGKQIVISWHSYANLLRFLYFYHRQPLSLSFQRYVGNSIRFPGPHTRWFNSVKKINAVAAMIHGSLFVFPTAKAFLLQKNICLFERYIDPRHFGFYSERKVDRNVLG